MAKKKCPLLNKKCIKHDCEWYTQVMGVNNNTGEDVNDFGCAIAWLPVLMIENSNQQRGTGAAVESFRNEMVKANHASLDLVANTLLERNK
ncbi:MAG: hypothetical protein DRQ48_09895 [Gammaproteobacteria bacterium]|nr:MAG: hypothetical protein DRQ48_09895 [Gammaproteobacteria bacterium]